MAAFENLTPTERKRALRQVARIKRLEFRMQRAQSCGDSEELQRCQKEFERRNLELRLYELKNSE